MFSLMTPKMLWIASSACNVFFDDTKDTLDCKFKTLWVASQCSSDAGTPGDLVRIP